MLMMLCCPFIRGKDLQARSCYLMNDDVILHLPARVLCLLQWAEEAVNISSGAGEDALWERARRLLAAQGKDSRCSVGRGQRAQCRRGEGGAEAGGQ